MRWLPRESLRRKRSHVLSAILAIQSGTACHQSRRYRCSIFRISERLFEDELTSWLLRADRLQSRLSRVSVWGWGTTACGMGITGGHVVALCDQVGRLSVWGQWTLSGSKLREPEVWAFRLGCATPTSHPTKARRPQAPGTAPSPALLCVVHLTRPPVAALSHSHDLISSCSPPGPGTIKDRRRLPASPKLTAAPFILFASRPRQRLIKADWASLAAPLLRLSTKPPPKPTPPLPLGRGNWPSWLSRRPGPIPSQAPSQGPSPGFQVPLWRAGASAPSAIPGDHPPVLVSIIPDSGLVSSPVWLSWLCFPCCAAKFVLALRQPSCRVPSPPRRAAAAIASARRGNERPAATSSAAQHRTRTSTRSTTTTAQR